MILDVLRLEEEVKRLKGDPQAASKTGSQLSGAGQPGDIARLKKELATANAKVAAMEKQTQGLQKEYDRLGDEKSGSDGTIKKDR